MGVSAILFNFPHRKYHSAVLRPKLDIAQLIANIKARDIASLSRAITLVESQKPTDQALASQLVNALLPYTGRAKRIGITGVPGVGKSTFIEAFGLYLIAKGLKVAVLAVDPSSGLSKGSILGDKTRMMHLSVHKDAYIRPTASGGYLGGIASKTRETMLLCEAAGFDVIIVETVGVGQSETELAQVTDFFLLLMLAGAGDELQGIKRGIMEMADGLIINKADGENIQKAKNARAEYARALHFFPPHSSGWIPQVHIASALEHSGLERVWEMISQFYLLTTTNGSLAEKRKAQNIAAFHQMVDAQLRWRILHKPEVKEKLEQLLAEVTQGALSPYLAAQRLFENL